MEPIEHAGGTSSKLGRRRPGLAVVYEGGEPVLLERLLPVIDFLEVTPDAIARADGDGARISSQALAELKSASAAVDLVVHGVGLSICSHDRWSDRYIGLLDQVYAELDVRWHSEHLAYAMVDGEHLGTMLPPPRTEEMLTLVCQRVNEIQRRFPWPFLLENVIHILPDPGGDYSMAGFFNEIAKRTGCGLLVDVYNLECDLQNQNVDVTSYLDELDVNLVREVHIADGTEHRGFRLDVHSGLTRDATIELARDVVQRADGAVQAITYELLAEAVPVLGHDAIVGEVERLRQIEW